MNAQSTQNSPFLKKLAIILVAIAVAIWVLAITFADKKPSISTSTASEIVNIGQIGIIHTGLVAGRTKDAYDEIMKAANARDEYGLKELISEGKAIYVDNNTKVKVIEQGFAKKRVRLMSGDNKGAAVWVPSEFVESN